jgi:ferritin-like protein
MSRYHSVNKRVDFKVSKIVLIILFFFIILSGCIKAEVPAEVKHTGEVKYTVSIQIALPTEITNAYDTVCKNQCGEDPSCFNLCTAQKQEEYIDQLLELIKQFQNTIPIPTPGA